MQSEISNYRIFYMSKGHNKQGIRFYCRFVFIFDFTHLNEKKSE